MPGEDRYNERFNFNCDGDAVNLSDLGYFADAYSVTCSAPPAAGAR